MTALGLALSVVCGFVAACGSNTAPTPTRAPVILQFSALTGPTDFLDQITEQGFQVRGLYYWFNNAGYGNPAPSIWLYRNMRSSEVTGDLTVTAVDGGLFTFTSVDLSPVQPTSYTLTGTKSEQTVFVKTGTAPHINGQLFSTLQGDHPDTLLDTLVISMIEPFNPCCEGYTYVDNISLKR